MLSINGLSFSYGRKTALNSISLDLKEGGITALIGQNGAGKTTLMRAITGLLPITENVVTMDGIDVASNPRKIHQMVGFLPDMLGFYPSLTVQDNLAYAAQINGLTNGEAQQAVENTLLRLDLTSKKSDPAGSLSRGWRQRISIAQAIVHSPRFLALDEPATGLDPDARLSLSKLFLELNETGMTLIVSSHILAELEDYCNHIIMLEDGELVGQRDIKNFLADKKSDVKTLRIELTDDRTSIERALLILSQDTQCNDIFHRDRTITLRFHGTDADQHILLKNLFAADVHVLNAGEDHNGQRETLRDAYHRMNNKTLSR